MIKRANYFSYLGYKLFGKSIRKNAHKYYELEKSLIQAMISMPPEMYIATARMISFIFAIVGGIVGLIVSFGVIYLIGLPETLFPITLPDPLYGIWMTIRPFVFGGLIIAVVTTALYFIGRFAFTLYPSTVISDRKSKIDKALPHAITYMYSLSQGGMDLIQIFKSISNYPEVYGEISKEAARIVRDMEILGQDLRTALSNAVELSPSENLREFLHGLITLIDSGGDMTKYFENRGEFYLERSRQDQKNFLEFLGLMAESYITAFVAGPLFLIIIQTVMVVMGQGSNTSLYAVIYLVIPVGSFFFAMIIKLLTPSESGKPLKLREMHQREPGDSENAVFIREKLSKWRRKKTIYNPLEPIKRQPFYAMIFSLPAGIGFILYGIINGPSLTATGFMDWFFAVDDYIFLSVLIIFGPFVLFHEIGKKKINQTLRLTPVFLNKLASANESGMSVYRAITMIANTDTTPLKKEIKKIKSDLDWGISLNNALIRFANRLRVFELSRTTTLLNEALKSTGNVTEVLMISAKDTSNAELLRRERLTNMFMYVVIIYISFFVFIGIVYIISTTFLSTLAESAGEATQSGASASMGMMSKIDTSLYNNIFMHAAVFQGLFAGMVAGVMGEGSLSSGIKHSLIMLTLAYVLFNVLI